MSQLRNLIFHHDSPISSLSKSPSSGPSPPRNHQNSSSPSSQSTPRRRFKRKCTNVKNVETKEQKEVQRRTGIDAGLVRLTKDGDMVNVPWQDPAPSTVYRHQNTRQERSCLDHFDEPVFSSFSGKFACQRQPLKLELGMPLPQEKLSPAQKRAIQHKKLEAEEADAEKILPPPARPPRLPIHVTTNDDDDDYVEEYDDDYYYYGYDDQDCSTGTLSNMPPSTKNDAVEHGTPVKQGTSYYVSPAASPSVRTYHMNKKKEREELERQLHHLQHYVGAAASIPRPSHSPRALRQFMTPARSAAEILHSVGDSRSASRASSSARHTSRPASAVIYQSHQRNKNLNCDDNNNNDSLGDDEVVPVPHSLFGDSTKFQEAFDSPGRRSSAPLQVTDLVNIVKRPRPSSASIVMAISEKITSAARLRKQVAESQQEQPQHTEGESVQKQNEQTPTNANRSQHQQQRVNESFRSHMHQPQSGSTPPSRASTASISRPLSAAVGSPSSSRTKQHNQPQHRYSPANNNNNNIRSKSPQRKVDMIAKLAASGSCSMMTSPNDDNQTHLESPPRSFGSTVLRGDLSQQRKNHQQLASKQRGMNNTSPSSDQQQNNNTGGSFYGRTSRGGNTTPSEQGRTVNNMSSSSFGRVGSSGPMTSPRFGSMTFGRLHQTVTIVEDEK